MNSFFVHWEVCLCVEVLFKKYSAKGSPLFLYRSLYHLWKLTTDEYSVLNLGWHAYLKPILLKSLVIFARWKIVHRIANPLTTFLKTPKVRPLSFCIYLTYNVQRSSGCSVVSWRYTLSNRKTVLLQTSFEVFALRFRVFIEWFRAITVGFR